MKKLKYTDEENFVTEEVNFNDNHYNLANKLHKIYKKQFNSECSPIMVSKDKSSLLFCVNFGDKSSKDRVELEKGINKYKIIIEKI